jgi:hypothetical protein
VGAAGCTPGSRPLGGGALASSSVTTSAPHRRVAVFRPGVGARQAAPVTWGERRSAAATLPQRELPAVRPGVPAPRRAALGTEVPRRARRAQLRRAFAAPRPSRRRTQAEPTPHHCLS